MQVTIAQACEHNMILSDMEFSDELNLQLAWLDDGYNLGDEVDFDLANVVAYDAEIDGGRFDNVSTCSDEDVDQGDSGGEIVETGVREMGFGIWVVNFGLSFLVLVMCAMRICEKESKNRSDMSGLRD